eukprot:TRINITY_DN20553_c0_g1_i2.p2 TRINITY_DN20553_c0_g1~~TRINITY_DN20553_c0_g1_i2.p2  ORF type:complete len:194 (+),score=35.18 TRINITY_DN20553_c0_g1_i2:861-1442(+)
MEAHRSSRSSSAPASVRSRAPAKVPIIESARGDGESKLQDDDLESQEDDEQAEAPLNRRVGKLNKLNKTKHNGRKELQAMSDKFGDDADHWANYKRKTEIENTLRSLRKWGRSLGRMNDAEATSLSASIFSEADHYENKQSLFEDLSADFVSVVTSQACPESAKVIANQPEARCGLRYRESRLRGDVSYSPFR